MAACKICGKQVGCPCNLERGMCRECAKTHPKEELKNDFKVNMSVKPVRKVGVPTPAG